MLENALLNSCLEKRDHRLHIRQFLASVPYVYSTIVNSKISQMPLAINSVSCCHSDNEEDRPSRNGKQETLEFKDEEETVTTKSIQITQATETTTTTTRKRSGGTSGKTLDLGAAAHYTGDKSPEEKVLTPSEN